MSLFEDETIKEVIRRPTANAPILTNEQFKANFHNILTFSPAECNFQKSILAPFPQMSTVDQTASRESSPIAIIDNSTDIAPFNLGVVSSSPISGFLDPEKATKVL